MIFLPVQEKLPAELLRSALLNTAGAKVDMPGDIFIEKPVERKSRWWRRKSSEGKKKREQENILIPPIPEEPTQPDREVDQRSSTEWQERGFSEQTGKNDPKKDI